MLYCAQNMNYHLHVYTRFIEIYCANFDLVQTFDIPEGTQYRECTVHELLKIIYTF